MKLDRAKLEKIGIFASLASAAVGVYLYERQKNASAAAPASTDLSDPYAGLDLSSQPTIMPTPTNPTGDSSQSSGAGITLPGVPNYGVGAGGVTVPIDTSPVQSAPASGGNTIAQRGGGVVVLPGAGAGTSNNHTTPIAVTGVNLTGTPSTSPTTVTTSASTGVTNTHTNPTAPVVAPRGSTNTNVVHVGYSAPSTLKKPNLPSTPI